MTNLDEVLKSKKAVFGSERAMKMLKQDKIKAVLLSSNCPKSVREDFKHYSKMSNVEIVELNMKNREVGVICKRPFSISVVGMKK